MDSLALGALIATITYHHGIETLVKPARIIGGIALSALLPLIYIKKGLWLKDPLTQTLGYTLLDIFFAV